MMTLFVVALIVVFSYYFSSLTMTWKVLGPFAIAFLFVVVMLCFGPEMSPVCVIHEGQSIASL